ncbi:peptidase family M48-domain-containing protein [Chytriomyces cf. hyalinus JEL632]|nr:peptidase family M48-domain-containing protein [Chytriomyces cf. hyalinus JEL632]
MRTCAFGRRKYLSATHLQMIRTAFVRSDPLRKPAQSILRSNQHRWPTRSHNNPFILTPRRHYAAPLLPPLFLLNTARIALTTVPILHRFKSIRSLTYGILAITAFTTAAVLVQTTEQHPFTQRTRLMLIDETSELAAAEDTERQLMVTHAHAILPDFHPWSRVVHRVVDRLIGVVGIELRAWKVVVIDQRDCVNAMVLANGTIFVFTGILHALWEMERDLDGGSIDSRQQRATVDVEEAVARALAVALNGGKEKGSWWKSLVGMTFWSGRLSPPVSPDLEVGPMFTDTLAAVLAHEMAHVLSRHSAEDLGLTQFFQLFIDGLHGVLYALSVNLPGLTDLAGMGVDAVAPYLSTLPVSRLMEVEADVVGLFLMAVAGFNPSRASLFWKYLADRQGNPGDVDWNMFEEFLSTHPSHVRRSLELEKHETAAMEIYRAHKRIEDALRLHLKRGMADGTLSREREAAALDQLNHGMYTVLSEFVSSHDAFWYARKGFDQKLLEREQQVVKEYPVQNN